MLDNKGNHDFSQVWENYSIDKLKEETNTIKARFPFVPHKESCYFVDLWE